MASGIPTPKQIRDFVIETHENAPELSNRLITDKVEAKFGRRIDKSTVGRIRRTGSGDSRGARSGRSTGDGPRESAGEDGAGKVADGSVKAGAAEIRRTAEVRQMGHLREVFDIATSYLARMDAMPDDWIRLPGSHFMDEALKVRQLLLDLTGSPYWPVIYEHMGEPVSNLSHYAHVLGGSDILTAGDSPGRDLRELVSQAHMSAVSSMCQIDLAADAPDWLWRGPRCSWCEPRPE